MSGRKLETEMRTTLLLLLAAIGVCGDEVHLKNGAVLHGTVVAEEHDGLWLAVAGRGRIKILHEELERVVLVDDGGLGEASELLRIGAWQTAVEHITAALAKEPDHPELNALLQRAYRGWVARLLALDQPYRADEVLAAARVRFPSAPVWEALEETLSVRLDALDSLAAEALRRQLRGDYAGAIERFEALALAAPLAWEPFAEDYALCEARLGDDALGDGQWQAAVTHFSKALELSPILSASLGDRLVYAWGLEIRELISAGALESARPRVAHLRREYPGSRVGVYFDALLTRREGRFAPALLLYQRLFPAGHPLAHSTDFGALHPGAEALVSELLGVPVGGRQARWQETTSARPEHFSSEHFRIEHKNQLVVAEVADALESARQKVVEALGWREPPEKIEVVLHSDEASYLKAGGCALADGVVCRGGPVKPRRIDLLQSAPRLLDSMIPHAVAHVLWRNAVHGSDSPLWLREGVATLFEPATARARFVDIFARRVCRCDDPTLLQLIGLSSEPSEDQVAYAHVVVALLAETGEPEDLLLLGRMLVNDLPLQFALHRVYGFGRLEDLERAVNRRFGAGADAR